MRPADGGTGPDVPDESWMAFSATNVRIWRVAVGVERGYSGGAVLQLAGQVDEGKLAASRAAGQRSLLTWAGGWPASSGRSVTPSGGCAGPRTPRRSGSGTARRSAVRLRTCWIVPSPPQGAGNCEDGRAHGGTALTDCRGRGWRRMVYAGI